MYIVAFLHHPLANPNPYIYLLKVHLSLLDGSCKRSLSVTSPLIEAASQQYIALGAGSSVVNGTFDLSGWHNGGPVYVNASGVSITIEKFGARKGWAIGEKFPSIIYYGNPGEVNRIRPLDLHWTLVAGGVGEDPPPTVCAIFHASCIIMAFSNERPFPSSCALIILSPNVFLQLMSSSVKPREIE